VKIAKRKKVRQALERVSSPVHGIWPNTAEAIVGILAFLVIAFGILTYSVDLSEYTSKLVTSNKYVALLEGLFNPFRTKHILLKSGLPIYDIKIKRQQFALIEGVVEKAKKQGWMSDDLKVWANARFIYEGKSYNVKIRARGDLPRHWNGPKKSWRIKFGKERVVDPNGQVHEEAIYFDRTRQINLIVPIDRDFILSKFINSLMREKGLLVPRDKFAVLRINGVLQGLYYQIEHFDKPLMAFQKRPETTVFAQNDRAKHFEQYTKLGTPITEDARFDLGSMRHLVDRNGELGMQAMNALIEHSLHQTKENFIHARAVLDWEKLQYFRVLTTLCNTNHVRFGSDNLRLYYDSSRGLLEPIPWDAHLVKMPKEPGTIDFFNSKGPDALQRATLMDPQLRLERNKMLWGFIGDGGDTLVARYRKLHNRIRPYVWADVLSTPIGGYKMDVLKKNLEYNVHRAYKVLSNSNCNFTYQLETENRAALEMTVMNFSGVDLRSVQLRDSLVFAGDYRLFEDSNENEKLDADDRLLTEVSADENWTIDLNINQQMLPEIEYDGDFIAGRYWEYFDTKSKRARFFLVGKLMPEVRDPILWSPPQIKVAARNAVSGYQIPSAVISQTDPLPDNTIGITAYDHSDPFDLDAPFLTREQFLTAHPEFEASASKPGAVELSGKVVLAGTTIIPHDVPLVIQPGTDITMQPRANVLCYGGFSAEGTQQDSIRIHGAGSGRIFGVWAVVRPPEAVTLAYLHFSNASQAQINGTLFTGGLAVHEGDLNLSHTRISNMQSEDGVNLKNGHLSMSNCVIAGSNSDAIDIDFGQGHIKDCKFVDIGGDGVDMSGSRITISGSVFQRVVDKGISVGEQSNPTIYNTLLNGCGIGISMKDLSHARIAYCTFVGNSVALEAKRKKPMFGGASGEALNCVFTMNRNLLHEDYFSRGGVKVAHSMTDVETDWETNKAAQIRFVAPDQDNFLLEGETVSTDGFTTTRPAWLGQDAKFASASLPGIFSLYSN